MPASHFFVIYPVADAFVVEIKEINVSFRATIIVAQKLLKSFVISLLSSLSASHVASPPLMQWVQSLGSRRVRQTKHHVNSYCSQSVFFVTTLVNVALCFSCPSHGPDGHPSIISSLIRCLSLYHFSFFVLQLNYRHRTQTVMAFFSSTQFPLPVPYYPYKHNFSRLFSFYSRSLLPVSSS